MGVLQNALDNHNHRLAVMIKTGVKIGKRTGRVEYGSSGGVANDIRCMAGAQRVDVLIAAADRQLSQALVQRGGKPLSGAFRPGGYRCPEYTDRAQSAPGRPYYEEVLMHKERSYGLCLDV